MIGRKKKVLEFLMRNGFAFTIALMLGYLAILFIPFNKLFVGHFDLKTSRNISQFIRGSIIVTACIYFIGNLGLKKYAGIKFFRIKNPVLLLIPLFYPIGIGWLGLSDIAQDSVFRPSVLLAFASAISLGIAEECAFRGLLLPYLLEKLEGRVSLFRIVCLAAFPFAFFHMINLSHMGIAEVLAQVIFAFFYGVFLGSLLLRTCNVFILGVLHGGTNFLNRLETLAFSDSSMQGKYLHSVSELAWTMLKISLFFLPLFIIGFFLLRGWNHEKLNQNMRR